MRNMTRTKPGITGPLQSAIAGLLVLAFVLPANAGPREQAKRIHDRLADCEAFLPGSVSGHEVVDDHLDCSRDDQAVSRDDIIDI